MTIHIVNYDDDDESRPIKLSWASGEGQLVLMFPAQRISITLNGEALKGFADACDDALGRRARKKKP